MTTTSAADAMTILRRLIFTECFWPRPRVLPPIVILRSPDDRFAPDAFIAATGPMINHLIAVAEDASVPARASALSPVVYLRRTCSTSVQ